MNAQDKEQMEEILGTLNRNSELQQDDCDWLIAKLREVDAENERLKGLILKQGHYQDIEFDGKCFNNCALCNFHQPPTTK